MIKTSLINISEFLRFFLVGITATCGNLCAVWLALHIVAYKVALIAGILTGLTISFILSKFFTFRKRSWKQAHSEIARFLTVYAIGSASYWTVAVIVRYLVGQYVTAEVAEMGGALMGAGSMMVTSYFGHRFFTYRTYRR